MRQLENQILCGDCVEILRSAEEPFADLVFADPPFNIGYRYDKYHDSKASEKYLAWTRDWIGECVRVLKPLGRNNSAHFADCSLIRIHSVRPSLCDDIRAALPL